MKLLIGLVKFYHLNKDNYILEMDVEFYDKGIFLSIYLANMFIGQFVHPVKGDRVKGVEGGNRYLSLLQISLLENMKIWCKIQVIIYPLF